MSLQALKAQRTEEARQEMQEAIKTLKTTVSFISEYNQFEAARLVKIINCLNRYIKSCLSYTEMAVMSNKWDTSEASTCSDPQTIETYRISKMTEKLDLIAMLTK